MSPHEPVRSFVDNYMKLLPETDASEFQKVLEMKASAADYKTILQSLLYNLIYYNCTKH